MVAVNGEMADIAGRNLLEYLTTEGYQLSKVVVERNYEILSYERLAEITLEEEDIIEVLRFVGGG